MRRALMSVWLSRRTVRPTHLGISGNFKAKVRIAAGGVADIRGRVMLGDYETSSGYVARGLPAIIEVKRSGRLEVFGRVTAGDGARILVQSGVMSLGDEITLDGDMRVICTDRVSIGNGCAIAWGATIMDADFHSIDGGPKRAPVRIGEHVWIGVGATILKGVSIGDGAVVAAGAVVVADVAPHTVVAGVPARPIRSGITWV